MTEREAARQRRRIERFWKKWRRTLGLDEWETALNFNDGEYIQQDGEASGEAVASAHARWQYRHASVSFNLERVARLDEEDLEQMVIHEAMHIILNEMREEGVKHEERVASSLAFAFMRSRGNS